MYNSRYGMTDMKKIFTLLIFILICSQMVFANEIEQMPLRDLSIKSKISVTDGSNWSEKFNKKDNFFQIKGGDIYSKSGDLLYETKAEYLFISSGRLIGCLDFKFYEYIFNENSIQKREMLPEETADIFKDFKVIKLSDFSELTHAYKFKKQGNEQIILINDLSENLDGYDFSTNNSKFAKYNIKNAIKITKTGIIEFSCTAGYSDSKPIYVLLVR